MAKGYDSSITIAIRGDNSKFKQDLKETETIAKEADKKITGEVSKSLSSKSDEEAKFLERHLNYLKDMEKRFAERKPVSRKLSGEIDQPYYTFKDDSVVDYTYKIGELEAKLQQLLSTYNIMSRMKGFDEQSKEAQNLQEEIEKTATELGKLKQKQQELNQAGFQGINFELQGIGEKINGVIRKIGRWAIALFGVRTAFSFIRQSMNLLDNDENRIETKINNIKLVLVASLEPVIINIINLIVKMLSYLNYITKSWFGIDLFANAAELASRKMKDNVEGAAGAAEEMRKTLAGFDEMNIVGDNVSAAGGGIGGGGAALDPNDFIIEEQPVADWFKNIVDWIKENKDMILGFLQRIGELIVGWKLGQLIGQIAGLSGGLAGLAGALAVMFTIEAMTDIVQISAAAYQIYADKVKLASDETDTLYERLVLLQDISENEVTKNEEMADAWSKVKGVLLAFNHTIEDNLYERAEEAKEDADILKYYEKKMRIEDVDTALKNLNDTMDESRRAQDEYVRAVDKEKETNVILQETLDNLGISQDELNNIVSIGDQNYQDLDDTQKNVYKVYRDHFNAEEDLKDAIDKKNQSIKDETIANYEKMLSDAKVRADMEKTDQAYEEFRDAVVQAWKDGKIEAKDAADLIGKANSNVSDKTRKTFTVDLPKDLNDAYTDQGWRRLEVAIQRTSDALTGIADGMAFNVGVEVAKTIGELERLNHGKGILVNVEKKDGTAMKTGGIVSIPRLATGAIINQPGRGVPIGNSAIGGEAGREGVIPLTDSQAMEILGRAIGRYISINATIPVKLGDRQIAREVRNIMAESDFAFNR